MFGLELIVAIQLTLAKHQKYYKRDEFWICLLDIGFECTCGGKAWTIQIHTARQETLAPSMRQDYTIQQLLRFETVAIETNQQIMMSRILELYWHWNESK